MSLIVPVLSKTPNLVKELVRGSPQIKFHPVANPAQDKYFRDSEILICDFDELGKELYNLPKAKWIQGTWAGVDKLIPFIQKFKPLPYTITRFTGDHFGHIMGEYVIANIINFERDFFKIRENQKNCLYVQEEGKIGNYRVIFELTVGILGTGNIGSRIGKYLHNFGAKVVGLGRRPHLPPGDEYAHITKYYSNDMIKDFLSNCDYIVNVLPHTEETRGFLDNDVLQNCKDREAVFINIGRGSIISESSLMKALDNHWISGAILDVYATEPLPKESRLWKYPQVFLTPHVAGNSRPQDIAEQFRTNLALYQANKPIPGTFDVNRGY